MTAAALISRDLGRKPKSDSDALSQRMPLDSHARSFPRRFLSEHEMEGAQQTQNQGAGKQAMIYICGGDKYFKYRKH